MYSGFYASSRKSTKKCVMRKNDAHVKVFDGRKHFIRCIQKTGENNLDELQANNS